MLGAGYIVDECKNIVLSYIYRFTLVIWWYEIKVKLLIPKKMHMVSKTFLTDWVVLSVAG